MQEPNTGIRLKIFHLDKDLRCSIEIYDGFSPKWPSTFFTHHIQRAISILINSCLGRLVGVLQLPAAFRRIIPWSFRDRCCKR